VRNPIPYASPAKDTREPASSRDASYGLACSIIAVACIGSTILGDELAQHYHDHDFELLGLLLLPSLIAFVIGAWFTARSARRERASRRTLVSVALLGSYMFLFVLWLLRYADHGK
jgi:hypothetical protein